jgi:DNA-binding CsgD family transcriptional regulator
LKKDENGKILRSSKSELAIREKKILQVLTEGKASKETGNILNITNQTVDTHRIIILHKKSK